MSILFPILLSVLNHLITSYTVRSCSHHARVYTYMIQQFVVSNGTHLASSYHVYYNGTFVFICLYLCIPVPSIYTLSLFNLSVYLVTCRNLFLMQTSSHPPPLLLHSLNLYLLIFVIYFISYTCDFIPHLISPFLWVGFRGL